MNSTQEASPPDLLESLREIKNRSTRIPYSWGQIVELYSKTPVNFKKVWRKANHQRYRERPEYSQEEALWIACNIVDGSLTNKRCYYCHATLIVTDIEDFERMTIEHLVPLSKGGTHTAGNVVNSCRFCNGLRDDLTEADLREIVLNPKEFFAKHPLNPLKMEQLVDFAEAYSYATLTQEEFWARNHIDKSQFQGVFHALKKRYREKWSK